ncbi:MAG TPA: hypothetical protein VI643_04090 [Planctomycetota bacterium]|nr:hypothetical protein [Planctomycetota bacterium]
MGRVTALPSIAAILLAGCGEGGEPELIQVKPPAGTNAAGHEKSPILPPPTLESVEKGAAKVAAFMEAMARYGFFEACDTPEKRLAFAREKLWKLPQMAIDDLLSRDMTNPAGSIKVALLEMDPANLLTLMPGAKPARLLEELSVLTRGSLQPQHLSVVEGNRIRFHAGKDGPLEVPCGSARALVDGLNAHAARWGGEFFIFEVEAAPIGVAFFQPEPLAAVRRDEFNPYR